MIEYDDADLKEWAARIWAAVEYRGNGLDSMKEFIAWLRAK